MISHRLPLCIALVFAMLLGSQAAAQVTISGNVILNPTDPVALSQMSVQFREPGNFGFVNGVGIGALGDYAFTLPDGIYLVQVYTGQTGYIPEVWVQGATDRFDPSEATLIDTSTSGVNFVLEIGKTISGNVQGESLGPVADARVDVNLIDSGFWVNSSTDASGDYTVAGLPDGLYKVEVQTTSLTNPRVGRRWNDRRLNEREDPVDVRSGSQGGINFLLPLGQVISGTVRDFSLNPLHAWVTVWRFSDNNWLGNFGSDGSTGDYAIAVEPGTYRVEANPHQGNLFTEFYDNKFFLDLADEVAAPSAGIDFTLDDATGATPIIGFVLEPGGGPGIPGVQVRLQRFLVDNFDIQWVRTLPDGSFTFAGLPDGDYQILFQTNESNRNNGQDFVSEFWNRCQDNPASCDPLVIDPNDFRVNIPADANLGTFELTEGGSISGTVCIGSEDSPCPQDPLPEAFRVQAQGFASGGRFQPFLPDSEVDPTNGSYRIRGLPAPATYRVQTRTDGTDYVPVLYRSQVESTFDFNEATEVGVASGAETTLIDLHVFLGGSISGQVIRASDSSPVANHPIFVHLRDDPLGRSFWTGASTDVNGDYTVRGLPTGDYQVRVDARSGNLANQKYPSPVPVTAPFDTPGIDFVLEVAGSISGRVTQMVGGSEEPVVNIRVSASDFEDFDFVSDARTDANGNYTIQALRQGAGVQYRVRIESRDSNQDPVFFNFIRETYDNRIFDQDADPVALPDTNDVPGIDFLLELGGGLSGTVTDTAFNPLANVSICVHEYDTDRFYDCTNTDANGFYLMRGMPASDWRVYADPFRQNLVGEYFDDAIAYGDATRVTVAPHSDITPTPITAGIDFQLVPGSLVSGQVTEAATTDPVPGIRVEAFNDSFYRDATTDLSGNYQILGAPPGEIRVQVDTSETDFARAFADVVVPPDAVVNFSLDPGSTVRGRVFEDDGDGIYQSGEERAGVRVDIEDFDSGAFTGSVSSGSDGSYEIRGLAAGNYRIRVRGHEPNNIVEMFWDQAFDYSDATPLAVGEGVVVTGIDFRVVEGNEIRGIVFFDQNGDGSQQGGEPVLANVEIRGRSIGGPFFIYGRSASDGSYVLHGAFPTEFRIFAEAQRTPYGSEYYRLSGGLPLGTFRESEATPVDAGPGDVLGVDLSLELGGSIGGVVTEEGGGPLANIRVDLHRFDGDGLWFGTQTNGNGVYVMDGLPPVEFQVSARDDNGVFVEEFYDGNSGSLFSEDALPVTVVARGDVSDPDPTVPDIDFDLTRGGTLQGLVYHDVNGNGVFEIGTDTVIPNVHITVEQFDEPYRCCFGTNRNTQSDGTFNVGGIPPNTRFRVSADAQGNFIRVFYDGVSERGNTDWSAAVLIDLSPGETFGLNFGLVNGGIVSGRVVDTAGNPIANVRMHANPLDFTTAGDWSDTDQNGDYQLQGLSPGEHRIEAQSDGRFRFEFFDNQTEWDAANPVGVTVNQTTPDIDFVLTVEPLILSGPTALSGARGQTLPAVQIVADPNRLANGLCGSPPCSRVEIAGTGVTLQNVSLDSNSGTFTFDLVIAADASLGMRTISVVNDFPSSSEDTVATAPDLIRIDPASPGGDPPPTTGERVYTPDPGANQVRVFSTVDNSFLGAIDVVNLPTAVKLASDGTFLFVSGANGRTTAIIDTRLGAVGVEVARALVLGNFDAYGLDATSDFIYTNSRESGDQLVKFLGTTSWEVEGQITVGVNPVALRINALTQRLYVTNFGDDTLSIVDVDPGSPTLHTVIATVPFPDGSNPNGLAFRPDGLRAYVVTNSFGVFALDTALAENPATADAALIDIDGDSSTGHSAGSQSGISAVLNRGIFTGAIDVATVDGTPLAFTPLGPSLFVLDISTDQVQVVRTLTAPIEQTIQGLRATADGSKLYASIEVALELYVVDIANVLTSPSSSFTKIDSFDGGGIVDPIGAFAFGPIPAAPPATAPVITDTGTASPPENGSPFTVTISGSQFGSDPIVSLQGTLVRGNVLSASSGSLQVEFPATTPAGDHRLIVTNPSVAGNESGLAPGFRVARPTGFNPTQLLYAASFGDNLVRVLEPDGSTDTIEVQPFSNGLVISADGRLGFVQQGFQGPRDFNSEPDNFQDVAILDLVPGSPSFRTAANQSVWILGAFANPTATPNLDNPNGLFVYAPNQGMSDTVSVFDVAACAADPTNCSELDIDDEPGTQSVPPTRFGGSKLPGITRIELDDNPNDRNLRPRDSAITPDGNLLYVVNNSTGSLSVVDTATRNVVAELTIPDFRALRITMTPVDSGAGVFAFVAGFDSANNSVLCKIPAAVFDVSACAGSLVVSEFPRELGISHDGTTVYLLQRISGQLLAVNAQTLATSVVDAANIGPGIADAVAASEDQLLYVVNSFRNDISVVDIDPASPTYHRVLTTLYTPSSFNLAVHPSFNGPAIAGVSPTFGTEFGGTPVTITGTNFAPGATVLFGGAPATNVVVDNPFSLSAETPSGSGVVDIRVTNPGGQFDLLEGRFTFKADDRPPGFIGLPFALTNQMFEGPAGSQTVIVWIFWRTNESATSFVDFGLAGGPLNMQSTEICPGFPDPRQHCIVLRGLAQGSSYDAVSTSTDSSSNSASAACMVSPCFIAQTEPDLTSPVIVSGPTVSTTHSQATIQWTTDEDSTTVVQFDALLDNNVGPPNQVGPDGTFHSVTLSTLPADTLHEYLVISADAGGNTTMEAIRTFRTDPEPDVTPPVVTSGPALGYVSNNLVLVTWETNEPATSFVNYGTASIFEQSVLDRRSVTSHNVFLTNLLAGTTYRFQIGSTDPSGNTVLSDDPFATTAVTTMTTMSLTQNFHAGATTLMAGTSLTLIAPLADFTTDPGPDVTPPMTLSTLVITLLSPNKVLLSITTNEAASIQAKYNDGTGGKSKLEPSFTKTPTLVLTGLKEATLYNLEVILTDPARNTALPIASSFTTPAAPDQVPPVISLFSVGNVTDTTAEVTWATDEQASSNTRFGPTGSGLPSQRGLLGLRMLHNIVLSGLKAGVVYEVVAESRDSSGNLGTSSVPVEFRTLERVPSLTSIVPTQAARGATVNVAINGTHFGTAPTVNFGSGINLLSMSVNPAGTQIAARIEVASGAAVGPRPVTVTTNGGTATGSFRIVDDRAPVVTITYPLEGALLTDPSVPVTGTVDEMVSQVLVNGESATLTDGVSFAANVVLMPGAGAQRISAVATDLSGNVGSAYVDVFVEVPSNTAPMVDITTPADGSSFVEGTAIEFNGNANDDEEGDLSGNIDWTSDLDGPLGMGEKVIATLSVGTHRITAAVTDGGGLEGSHEIQVEVTPASVRELNDFGLYASTTVTLDEIAPSMGSIGANGSIRVLKGDSGDVEGNLEAVGPIQVDGRIRVVGDVTTHEELQVDKNAELTVTGVITENADLETLALPMLDFTAGGDRIDVPKNGFLALPPGSYDRVQVKKGGVLALTSGVYHLNRLELQKDARILVELTGSPSDPVSINVVQKLSLAKNVTMELPSDRPQDVSIQVLQNGNLTLDQDVVVRATLLAPNARVAFKQNAQLIGACYAKEIVLDRGSHYHFEP